MLGPWFVCPSNPAYYIEDWWILKLILGTFLNLNVIKVQSSFETPNFLNYPLKIPHMTYLQLHECAHFTPGPVLVTAVPSTLAVAKLDSLSLSSQDIELFNANNRYFIKGYWQQNHYKIPYVRHYNPLLIWILTVHKVRILQKKTP